MPSRQYKRLLELLDVPALPDNVNPYALVRQPGGVFVWLRLVEVGGAGAVPGSVEATGVELSLETGVAVASAAGPGEALAVGVELSLEDGDATATGAGQTTANGAELVIETGGASASVAGPGEADAVGVELAIETGQASGSGAGNVTATGDEHAIETGVATASAEGAGGGLNYTFDANITGWSVLSNLYGAPSAKAVSRVTSGWANGSGAGYLKLDVTAVANTMGAVECDVTFDFSAGKKVIVKGNWPAAQAGVASGFRIIDSTNPARWIEVNQTHRYDYDEGAEDFLWTSGITVNTNIGVDRQGSTTLLADGQYLAFKRHATLNTFYVLKSMDGVTWVCALTEASEATTVATIPFTAGFANTVKVKLSVGQWNQAPASTTVSAFFENVKEG